MNNHSSEIELITGNITSTRTSLETCVLDADHKALEEHLQKNPVEQSDLDRCLLHGLRLVQQKERELSHVAPALTILLQFGARWNSDALLGDQKTPLHIICESSGDHHELLGLMIKSSQRTTIDLQDRFGRTALTYTVLNNNIKCLKCLIISGADINIGEGRYLDAFVDTSKRFTSDIVEAILMVSFSKYGSYWYALIMREIFDILLETAAENYKDSFRRTSIQYIQCALLHGNNVHSIKKLIKIGAPLDSIDDSGFYVWALIAREGNVELLNCMFDHGIHKDAIDQNSVSILGHVVYSGKVEAVRYLLKLGVAIPNYSLEVCEVQCEQCKENRLIMDHDSKQDKQDPCMIAICDDKLKIVKLLDEHGSQSCKTFTALRHAVVCGSVEVVSYLLNKYTYPLNKEYIIADSGVRIITLLTDSQCTSHIIKLLLDHGADPAKTTCASTSAIMTAMHYAPLDIIARYIRSGVDINFRSLDSKYGMVSPFDASVLHGRHFVSGMLLISGCSRGVSSIRKLKDNPNLELVKVMKKWNMYDNNVTPLRLRCRSVILNHLSPRADKKIENLPLSPCLIKFLSIPELDKMLFF